jgi:Zn-dependent protease
MRVSSNEKRDILKAYAGITLAFGIVLSRGFGQGFGQALIISALTVGVGFLFHELAHRYFARKYGAWAEFRSFDNMIVLAVLMSFVFGVVFAAPGAVVIRGQVNRERYGRIAAAGPVASLVAAGAFFIVRMAAPQGILADIGNYGAIINSWLAVFNLIPFGPFDGAKVMKWNKRVWWGLFGVAFLFMIAL